MTNTVQFFICFLYDRNIIMVRKLFHIVQSICTLYSVQTAVHAMFESRHLPRVT